MAHFHSLGLLMIGLFVLIQEGRAAAPVFEIVSATQQESVTLPCSVSNLTDPKSCYRVQWIKNQKTVILARPKTPKIQDAERVKWEADKQGLMSLVLTKLQKADEGTYSCEICKGWECTIVRNISLKVKDCKVLPAMKAAKGTPVSLPCSVGVTSSQQGPRNISWEMVKGDNTVTVMSQTANSGTTLEIKSVSQSDDGWYRCNYMLGQTLHCSEINLQVGNNPVTTSVPALTTSEVILEAKKEEDRGTYMPVVVSTTIIGIAAMVALILLIIYCMRNTQRASQQTQRHHTGATDMMTTDYEIVNFTPSDDLLNQRFDSLHWDESLCTFHCK